MGVVFFLKIVRRKERKREKLNRRKKEISSLVFIDEGYEELVERGVRWRLSDIAHTE